MANDPGIRLPFLAVLASLLVVSACATAPPADTSDACEIFAEHPSWYRAARRSYRKWGVPVSVQLAIIRQESGFDDDARPPRTRLLWVIPWRRPSSAYGYAQIIDETWEWYKKENGIWFASRDDFGDVADFIGWYGTISHRTLGIAKSDAERQYLAYHEGHGGYRRKTYRKKRWLRDVARKVGRNARRYERQLKKCESRLGGSWFWPF